MLRRMLRGLRNLIVGLLVVMIGVPILLLVLWWAGVLPDPWALIDQARALVTGDGLKKIGAIVVGGWVAMMLLDEVFGGDDSRYREDRYRDDRYRDDSRYGPRD